MVIYKLYKYRSSALRSMKGYVKNGLVATRTSACYGYINSKVAYNYISDPEYKKAALVFGMFVNPDEFKKAVELFNSEMAHWKINIIFESSEEDQEVVKKLSNGYPDVRLFYITIDTDLKISRHLKYAIEVPLSQIVRAFSSVYAGLRRTVYGASVYGGGAIDVNSLTFKMMIENGSGNSQYGAWSAQQCTEKEFKLLDSAEFLKQLDTPEICEKISRYRFGARPSSSVDYTYPMGSELVWKLRKE